MGCCPKEEQWNLIENPPSWKKQDYVLLLLLILITFGDGIEIYLPGVITQAVSCELGVTHFQEGVLGSVFYVTLALSITIAGSISDRFGRIPVTLFSLYTSALSTIFCAVVANYYTLLLSRALIGFCLGLNVSVVCILIAEGVSSKPVLDKILVIATITWTMGGVWVAILGYLVLDVLGWRVFVLLTSLPVFIPPILMLHCCIDPANRTESNTESETECETVPVVVVPNFVARTCKLTAFHGVCQFQAWGNILLVPALIKLLNIRDVGGAVVDCSETVTKGPDFIILSLVAFANTLGRLTLPIIRDKVSFRILQISLALIMVGSFAAMLKHDNIIVVVTTNFVVIFVVGMVIMEYTLIVYDVNYFGSERFALGVSVADGVGKLAGAAGVALAAFAPPMVAVITALVVSVMQILVVFSMNEQ